MLQRCCNSILHTTTFCKRRPTPASRLTSGSCSPGHRKGVLLLPFPHRMSLDPLIYNRLSVGFISRGYVLGLYLAEKGTRLSGIFDYPKAAKSYDSRIIGTCLYILVVYRVKPRFFSFRISKDTKKCWNSSTIQLCAFINPCMTDDTLTYHFSQWFWWRVVH